MIKTEKWSRKDLSKADLRRMGALEIRALAGDGARAPLSFFHIRLAARQGHAPVRHRRTHEWVYVLAGDLTARIAGKRLALRKGTSLYLPPGTWHAFTAGSRGLQAVSVFWPPIDWRTPDVEVREARA